MDQEQQCLLDFDIYTLMLFTCVSFHKIFHVEKEQTKNLSKGECCYVFFCNMASSVSGKDETNLSL